MAAARSRGKDSTKVDRSAAYAARYLAKNVVASGLADRCTIQLAYAIGVAEPLSVYVDTHGTGKVDEAKLELILPQLMNLKPRGIREHLDLNKPIFARTSAYGHFGREPDADGGFSWEKTDLADKIKSASELPVIPGRASRIVTRFEATVATSAPRERARDARHWTSCCLACIRHARCSPG